MFKINSEKKYVTLTLCIVSIVLVLITSNVIYREKFIDITSSNDVSPICNEKNLQANASQHVKLVESVEGLQELYNRESEGRCGLDSIEEKGSYEYELIEFDEVPPVSLEIDYWEEDLMLDFDSHDAEEQLWKVKEGEDNAAFT